MEKRIKIKPEGWIDTIVIEIGEFRCGTEHKGLGISINEKPGGVLKREDMEKLIHIFEDHLKEYPLTH